MKVIIRCVLAIVAIVVCITVVKNDPIVRAQSCCNPNWCPLPPPGCPAPLCNQVRETLRRRLI